MTGKRGSDSVEKRSVLGTRHSECRWHRHRTPDKEQRSDILECSARPGRLFVCRDQIGSLHRWEVEEKPEPPRMWPPGEPTQDHVTPYFYSQMSANRGACIRVPKHRMTPTVAAFIMAVTWEQPEGPQPEWKNTLGPTQPET